MDERTIENYKKIGSEKLSEALNELFPQESCDIDGGYFEKSSYTLLFHIEKAGRPLGSPVEFPKERLEEPNTLKQFARTQIESFL